MPVCTIPDGAIPKTCQALTLDWKKSVKNIIQNAATWIQMSREGLNAKYQCGSLIDNLGKLPRILRDGS